jgi:FAD/FMN-containing dehydrogenase
MVLDTEGIRSVGSGTVQDLIVSLDPFVPQGRTVRFGFSIEIVQGGKRLGGMRSGAICSIRFSSRAHRHYRACTPVGFKKHA